MEYACFNTLSRPAIQEDRMQTNRKIFLMTNLVLAMCLTGSATQTQETGVEAGIPTAKLLTTMRVLNTAQVSYEVENHRFASQVELLASLRQKNFLGKSVLNLDNPAPYQVQVTTDPSATHYQISIQRPADPDNKSTWCRTAAFSDERGVIYLGQAIDCPAAPH
jgi:hypothetical protein